MDIFYLGSDWGTSKHRAVALMRLGHHVKIIDPRGYFPKSRLVDKWNFETGGLFFEDYVHRKVLLDLPGKRFDLVIVNGGDLVGPSLIDELRARFGPVVNYNNDDPFGRRDRTTWRLYLKAVPAYDLIVVVREVNISEAYAAGAKRVIRVFMSADEIAHAPRTITDQDRIRWANDVIFIGTWMPERGPFLAQLIEADIPLTIYGGRWHKAKEWSILRKAWKGLAIYGDDYAKAIKTSKVSLGLLSKGNRDLHTRRSMEIPALGGLLCAERTCEHLELYKEGYEAVFWSSPKECVEMCKMLLADETRRNKIARQGRIRCIRNGYFNERVMSKVLSAVCSR